MNTVMIVIAICFFVAILVALLFVSREGGNWRFGFKLGKNFSGGASGTGRGASITKSTSTGGGATATDRTGHSATITETTTKGDLTAEVSAPESVKKKS